MQLTLRLLVSLLALTPDLTRVQTGSNLTLKKMEFYARSRGRQLLAFNGNLSATASREAAVGIEPTL